MIGECAKVLQEFPDVFGWRRDEDGGAGVVVAATDPVLFSSDSPCVVFQAGPCEEPSVEAQEMVRGYLITRLDAVDGGGHGVDVRQDLRRGDVRRSLAELRCHLGSQKTPGADLEALDSRGSHGLCS
jgi:hypothetical protein